MFNRKPKEVEGRLDIIIYELATGEGDIKTRLRDVFPRNNIAPDELPDELREEWKSIMDFLTQKPAMRDQNSVELSLMKKRNKTCSAIAKRIYVVYDKMKRLNEEESS